MKVSLDLKLTLLIFAMMLLGAAAGAALLYFKSAPYALLIAAAAAVIPALLVARRATRPVHHVLRAMQTSVTCYTDGDFSVSLVVNRRDELGELLQANNELGNALRKQRAHLIQREMLLDTVAQHSPVALVLVDPHQRVVYANIAARHLLNEGRSLLGSDFAVILEAAPGALREAVATEGDCLFSTWIAGMEETFSLSQRAFMLQGARHRLFLLKTLTRELSRQEVATWKKLIRVVSHELNNSLASDRLDGRYRPRSCCGVVTPRRWSMCSRRSASVPRTCISSSPATLRSRDCRRRGRIGSTGRS